MSERCVIWVAVSTRTQTNPDKVSLEVQETACREWVAGQGGQVLEVLRVPGHSRDYVDIHECAADMRRAGIDAFDRLLEMWLELERGRNAFDTLVVWDARRFARTQALHAYIVERTIRAGARIYSLAEGPVGKDNYRLYTAMGGFASAGEVDAIRARWKFGMERRVRRGLTSTKVPFGLMLERDRNGKARRIVPDPHARQVLLDAVQVLLERVAYDKIENVLYERYGHSRPNGKPFSPGFMYKAIHNPYVWGHSALYYNMKRGQARTRGKHARWVYDPSVPPPDGVLIHYNTHEPLFDAALAARLIAELERRYEIRGSRAPDAVYRFSGLIVCDESGANMLGQHGHQGREGYRFYVCPQHWRFRRGSSATDCSQRSINEKRVVAWMGALLAVIIDDDEFVLVAQSSDAERADLARQLAEAEAQIANLLRERAQMTSAAATAGYIAQIDAVGRRVDSLTQRLARAESVGQTSEVISRAEAIGQVRTLGVQAIWQLSEGRINQLFSYLLGRCRLLARDGEIVGIRV